MTTQQNFTPFSLSDEEEQYTMKPAKKLSKNAKIYGIWNESESEEEEEDQGAPHLGLLKAFEKPTHTVSGGLLNFKKSDKILYEAASTTVQVKLPKKPPPSVEVLESKEKGLMNKKDDQIVKNKKLISVFKKSFITLICLEELII